MSTPCRMTKAENEVGNLATIPLWLNGTTHLTEQTLPVIFPVTGKASHQATVASLEDAEAAIASCASAFPAWSRSKPALRRDIFLEAALGLTRRKDEIWNSLHVETGVDRKFFEVTWQGAIDMCKDVAGRVVSICGKVPAVQAPGSSAIVFQEPYGVVLGIAPWNAPLVLGLRACLQPLACGNTVILKGSELSPKTFWIIGSILHDAGLPAGCLNTLIVRPGADAAEVTDHILASPLVRKISFTGSTTVGSILASKAGKYLKPVVMELGGKAAAIICDDANISEAAEACVLGAFLNSGQICMSTERILVHQSIGSKFELALKQAAEKIFPDNGQGLYLVTTSAVNRNQDLLNDAVAKGARPVFSRAIPSRLTSTSMLPVAIAGVTKEMSIFHQESFGPVVALTEFETETEAISLANDTQYGLSAAVFTIDLQRGLRIAKSLQSGAVHINGMTPHDEPTLPHGGYKSSGWGRFNASEGLSEWLQTKSVTWKD